MSRKNTLQPIKFVSAGDMSGTITSKAIGIQFLDNIALQFNFTGTPTGTFSVQGSLDHAEYFGTVTKAGTWNEVTLDPVPAAAGAAGSILINMDQLAFPFLRVVYTAASGTGSLDAYITAKMI